MAGLILPRLLMWESRLSIVLRPGSRGLALLQPPHDDGFGMVIATVLFTGLIGWLVYVVLKRASAPVPFPFLGVMQLIGQSLARCYYRRIMHMVDVHLLNVMAGSTEMERAIRGTEILRQGKQDALTMPSFQSRRGEKT